MIDIALFPIPESVSFPGTVLPLHVFEPRYREMVKYCIAHDMPIAVCHTQKVLHESKPQQNMEQALNSNQSTYKPCDIFSAGTCELVETLDDGRLFINVHMQGRYERLEPRQILPFEISACEVFADMPMSTAEYEEAMLLKEKVLTRLIAMTAHLEKAQTMLRSEEWKQKAADELSFGILNMLPMDGDWKQHALEQQSPLMRLNMILHFLNT